MKRTRRKLWPAIVVFVIAVTAIGLLYAVWRAPDRSDLENFGAFAVPVLVAAASGGRIVWSWLSHSRQGTTTGGTAKPVTLADQLAEVLEGQWTREANRRGLLAPEPIPVKWGKPLLPVAGPPEAAAGSHLFVSLPGLRIVTATDLKRGGDVSDLHAVYGGLGSGRLVIAGSAGSGKSGAAVLLVLAALRHRKHLTNSQRLRVPVPLLFTAQEWDPVQQPVRDWLTQQIQQAYPLFMGEAKTQEAIAFINDGKIALILDGFDEIAEDLRPVALQALSQQTTFRVVILTRTAEMASAASERGVLEGAAAVELRRLDAETAAAYLARIQVDPPPDGWRQLVNYIRKAPESSLAMALDNPLTLTLIRDTYRKGNDIDELLEFCGIAGKTIPVDRPVEEIVDHLLDRFLSAAYMPRPGEKKHAYKYNTAQCAFAKIGAQMNRDGIRDLEPLWLFQCAPEWPRNMLRGLIAGLQVPIIAGIMAGLMTGVTAGVVIGAATWVAMGTLWTFVFWNIDRITQRRRKSENNLESSKERKTQRYEFKLTDIWRNLPTAVLTSATTGLLVGIVAWVVLGIVYGLIAGLLRSLLIGLVSSVLILITNTTVTPLGLWFATQDRNSLSPVTSWRTIRRNGVISGVTSGFVTALGAGIVTGIALGLVHGLAAGLLVGILFGLVTALANPVWSLLASVQLARRWHTPVRLMKFLDDAYQRNVLRTVGPIYQFRHARLQDRLASQDTEGALPDSKTSSTQ